MPTIAMGGVGFTGKEHRLGCRGEAVKRLRVYCMGRMLNRCIHMVVDIIPQGIAVTVCLLLRLVVRPIYSYLVQCTQGVWHRFSHPIYITEASLLVITV